MKKEIMSNYEVPVTEAIKVEVFAGIMDLSNPDIGGGGSGSGNDGNPED